VAPARPSPRPVRSRAELSHFFVDRNAGRDPREQLAAFVLNTRHRFAVLPTAIELPGGTRAPIIDLVDDAIAAWASDDADVQRAAERLLDALNNSDSMPFSHAELCQVEYAECRARRRAPSAEGVAWPRPTTGGRSATRAAHVERHTPLDTIR